MSEKPEDKPDAVAGVEGESDVVAERSGAGTPTSRRPISADLPEDDPRLDDPQEEGPQEERPQDGPQEERPQDGPQEGSEREEGNDGEVVRPDAGPTG
ncbi:hypothetical protein E1295_28370 [Nonomuraea mesophila]|uniref:Uncharacterized protein n=1 Tax=Nonomuraea mesophila TaxID=2530382 RepID=A0A4R5F3Q7_9ACTN|nr:hypothetical protein [Nonomuraea mesophila]TDE42200.1 hypothetical protein E1295_28370 [Nonomuraea mesophila]